ncbi:MAG: hypothetical protein ACREMF_10700 [Gemmatimonadales bacterium]
MHGSRGLARALTFTLVAHSCTPSSPCGSGNARRELARYSLSYAGHWVVARGDTLTLPEMGDRFTLTDIVLDTDTVSIARQCLYRGRLIFSVPKAQTLAVSWFGVPERVTVFGWPVDLGPFAGLNASWWGRDSLRGAILFDERLGVQMPLGATAQFVAGRYLPPP